MAEGNRLIAEVRILENASGGAGIPTFKSWRSRPSAAPFPGTETSETIFHNNVVWNGKMYLVGHSTEAGEQNSLVSYEEATDTWATLTPPPNKPTIPGIAVVAGKIYVFMGNINKLQVYDIATDTWVVEAAVPPLAVNDARAVAVGTIIYVLGQGSFYAYDTVAKTYTAKTNTPLDAGGDVDLDYLAGKIYAVGGFFVGTLQEKLYSYDIATDTWTALAAPPDAGHGMDGYLSSSTIYNGEIWKISGLTATSGTHVYNIATNTWRDDFPYPGGGGIYFPALAVINNILLGFGRIGGAAVSHMFSLDKTKYQINVDELGDVEGIVSEGEVLTAAATGWKSAGLMLKGTDPAAVTINVSPTFDFVIGAGDHTGNSGDYPIVLSALPETADYRLEPHLSGSRLVIKKPGLWLFYATFYINNAGSGLAADARMSDFFQFHVGAEWTELETVAIERYSWMSGARMLQTAQITVPMKGDGANSHLVFVKTNAPVVNGGLPNGHYTGGITMTGHRLTLS